MQVLLPVDKLLDDFHPSIQLVECQDVLLSEETQSRALSKILPETHKNKQTVTNADTTPKCEREKTDLEDKIQPCKGISLVWLLDGNIVYVIM